MVLENLYMLGRPDGRRLDEDSPVNPCSRKGEVQARVAEQLFRAHREGRVEAVVGRASDFYGPAGRLSSLGDWFWPDALALFMPMLRELKEMGYQWDEPFVVDEQRFRAQFGTGPTDPRTALAATATWALRQYGVR